MPGWRKGSLVHHPHAIVLSLALISNSLLQKEGMKKEEGCKRPDNERFNERI